jgi:hypothetical protein
MYTERFFLSIFYICVLQQKQTYFPALISQFYVHASPFLPPRRSCAVKFGLAGLVWASDQDDRAKNGQILTERKH